MYNDTWSISDVRTYLTENEIHISPELTDDECMDILEQLDDYALYDEYGPERGVSIDSIGDIIENMFSDRMEEDKNIEGKEKVNVPPPIEAAASCFDENSAASPKDEAS